MAFLLLDDLESPYQSWRAFVRLRENHFFNLEVKTSCTLYCTLSWRKHLACAFHQTKQLNSIKHFRPVNPDYALA